jgi:Fe-S cluster assembly protein SufD
MTTATGIGFQQEAFDAFLSSRQEPAWLADARRSAWQMFQELPLPSRHDEEWMRTDIRLLRLENFGFSPEPSADPASLPAGLLTEGVQLAGHTSALDSHAQSASLDPSLAAQGVLFGSLDELVRGESARGESVGGHGELIRKHLFTAVRPGLDKFAALHAACWSGGTFLYVPRGVVVERPLHMISLLSAGATDLGHTLVVLEAGAEATLLAETVSLDHAAPGLHCGAIELIVGDGARLRYVNLQNWSTHVWHFAHQHGIVARDGRLQWTIAALGSRLAKVNQHVALAGDGAEAQVNGVMFTEGKQHLSYHTLQHHQAPHCRSDLLYKGALQDSARTVWRGMIKVDKGAQKTDGYQRNDNLMLSDHARADSIPGLEIEADDVRCTHGSTTGRVDDEQVFYARCRGLTRKEAIRMIVAGFFQQVFDRITIESVREALGHAIGRRIREYD